MRIEYDNTINPGSSWVLFQPNNWRIELHIKAIETDRPNYSLITLAGKDQQQPSKVLVQGVYQCQDEAMAAAKGIIASLKRQGAQLNEQSVAIWSLLAQQEVRNIRAVKQENPSNYDFDPNDVYPE